MNKPLIQIEALHKALEPYGFKDNKYGVVPYTLQYSGWSHLGEDGHYHVQVDGRTIAEVGVARDGTYPVRMQLGTWMNPPRSGDILNNLLKPGSSGLSAVARAMAASVRVSPDYAGIARKLLVIDTPEDTL